MSLQVRDWLTTLAGLQHLCLYSLASMCDAQMGGESLSIPLIPERFKLPLLRFFSYSIILSPTISDVQERNLRADLQAAGDGLPHQRGRHARGKVQLSAVYLATGDGSEGGVMCAVGIFTSPRHLARP